MRDRKLLCLSLALAILLPLVTLLTRPVPASSSPPAPPAGQPGKVTSIVPPPPQAAQDPAIRSRLPNLSSLRSPDPITPRSITGNVNLLAILVQFSDNPATVTTLTVFDNLVFAAPVSGRGSVRDYYDEVTYGNVTLVTVDLPSTTGWQTAPQPYSYYVNNQYGWGTWPQNAGGMVRDVVPLVDYLVDFSNYDNDGDGAVDTLLVIHAGTGAEFSLNTTDIWSHASSITMMGGQPLFLDGVTIDRYVTVPEYLDPSLATPSSTDMTIGVICHEIGHGMWGLVDLYDLDSSSYGIGIWGLMSYGDWNGPAKWNPFTGQWITDGSSPAWPIAWSRLLMGVDTASLVLGPQEPCLPPVETLSSGGGIIRFKSTGLAAQEYFLAENRQRITGSYDEYLPTGGLLIWHVDEAVGTLYGGTGNDAECRSLPHCGGSCSTTHYLVALEQADGNDDLEYLVNAGDNGDPFPGSSNNTAWQWYQNNPTNPESGSWYDVSCSTDSCIDVTGIYASAGNVCMSIQQAACSDTEGDLGDAPSSINNYGNIPMTAYGQYGPLPWVQAQFPTVFMPGPRHHFAQVDSWLGATVSGELQADALPDQDGVPNIDPPNDIADQDNISLAPRDDGIGLPVSLYPCLPQDLPYTMTVSTAPPYSPPNRYLNVWFDWNRDGDWDDTLTCPGGAPAPEWAVQDNLLTLWQGVYNLTTPLFIPFVHVEEDGPFETWMRISVAEMMSPVPHDGAGPPTGYDLGETEDYYLWLDPWLDKTADLPADPEPGELITYHLTYGGEGNIEARDIAISDTLPLQVEYVSSDPSGVYDPGRREVVWMTDLIPDQEQRIDLVVQVTGAPGETVDNTAHLLWGGSIWRRDTHSFQIGGGGCISLTGVVISGTSRLTAGVESAYQAIPEPITATNPSYVWQDGTTGPTAVFSWTLPGSYTITVTATNCVSVTVQESLVVQVYQSGVRFVYLPLVRRSP